MGPYIVTWTMYSENPGDHKAAAQEIAEKYFQERIAAGEPDTACTFVVTNSKGESKQIDPCNTLAHVVRRTKKPHNVGLSFAQFFREDTR
jgi:hypothetical protein